MQFRLSYQDFYHGEFSKIGHQRLLCTVEQTIAIDYVPACARLYFGDNEEIRPCSMVYFMLCLQVNLAISKWVDE